MMVWPSRSLVVFIALPLFSIVAATLYFYNKKDKKFDYYPREQEVRYVEIKIPTNSISLVIGRGGENIKNIQLETNTKINFKTADANQDYRVCRIKGKKEDIELAEHIIREAISTQANVVTFEMKVPQKSCGRIIGRCGDNIRAISKASKCSISVDRMTDSASPFRLVTIRGSEDQIAVAKSMIDEKIAEDEEARNRMEMALATRSPRLKSKFKKSEGTECAKVPSYERLVPIANDSMLQVYVSAVADPTHFWLQLISPRAVELDHLVDNMTEYYKKEENRELHKLNEVTDGQIVACRVDEDDKWYRGQVCGQVEYNENREESVVDVFYVDYGDSAYQKLSDLLQLRADFLSLRFQAIECAMDGIMPKSGMLEDKWDEETVELFEDMVYTGQWKAISAQVVRYKARQRSNRREGSPVPCVKLYDPDGPPGVDIGQLLIDKGAAKPLQAEENKDDKEDQSKD
uniref:Putativekinase anchor protein n=1 Tax=Panstrongylus lignarius TaxID=156445 RepID=A0A224XPC3_9HEMI